MAHSMMIQLNKLINKLILLILTKDMVIITPAASNLDPTNEVELVTSYLLLNDT